ncbi:B3 domain-containing protein [Prunus yedoensis var. nudiflora]|uniref:B3 domain-containing protein n=1 Tax=Prunus yedoensis var. nudiflora TaxID=2094558 RepID=A0A314XGC0_PRUYE|nr:B3 domain-containing protein [Prunus yedoensis var. nudiflora]
MHPVAASGKDRALLRANAYKSKYPSFTAAIHPTNICGCYLALPAEFVKEHLNQAHDKAILRVSDERTWHVNLCKYGRAFRLQRWMRFVRENDLKQKVKKEDNVSQLRRGRKIGMARKSGAVRRKPSFFKALVGNFSNQLQIPPAFLVHFDGGKVPQKSHLWTSAGSWPVNVKKVDDKFFFQKGWKKFVHDNDLKLCEFLVFGCAGDLGFYVDIYGRNGCKRGFVMAERDRPHEEGHGNVIYRRSPRHHGKQNLPSVDPIKYEATNTESETSIYPLATSTGKTVLQRNNSFNSGKPFFKVAIQNSYICKGYMYLPCNFVKTHLTEQRATVTLRVSDGKTWPVKFGLKLSFTARQKLQVAPCHQANHAGGSIEVR